MNYKTSFFLCLWAFFGGVLVFLIGQHLEQDLMIEIGFLVAGLGIFQLDFFYHCPICQEKLRNGKYLIFDCCPHCGTKLDW